MRRQRVLVLATTVWEITRKVAIGKLAPLHSLDERGLCGFLRARGYETVPLSAEVADAAAALPGLHRDPMDRLLIAQALADGASVITNDRVFPACGVPTLW